MSTSLLYHAFGIRGYEYTRTDYQDGQTIFTIHQDPKTCRCWAPTQKVQPSPLLGRMQGEVIRSGRLVDVLPFWFQVGQGRSACWAGS
jgi:hypothetical protein